jgi:hypothetical protein
MIILAFAVLCFAEPGFEKQEIETNIRVGYAVNILDINADDRPDILVLDGDQVLWYENPSWKRHIILKGQTIADNVCMAAHDINGDGKVDLALGADWPNGSKTQTNVYWLEQTGPQLLWRLHPIGNSPFVHRMQWHDLDDDKKPELVVVPLWGPGESQAAARDLPVTISAFSIPTDPKRDRWKSTPIPTQLRVTHQFMFDAIDGRGTKSLLVTSLEGLTQFNHKNGQWEPKRITRGDQSGRSNLGCSEITLGKSATGKSLATIEPWHGDKVVVYDRPEPSDGNWRRTVVDSDFEWGHAVQWADLDGDGIDELIAGIRNDLKNSRRGVRIYHQAEGAKWKRRLIDSGGVAVEALAVGDLDGDHRPDIVAAGRGTHNVRIYWNRK